MPDSFREPLSMPKFLNMSSAGPLASLLHVVDGGKNVRD